MMNAFVHYVKKYLLSFIQLQLLLTCVSLPLLIAWGLPLSLLSFFGNFIFSPFLTLFLFLSSLLFFTEIVHIPNSALAYLLDALTNTWTTLLALGPSYTLIGFARPSLVLLIMIPCIAVFLLFHKQVSTVNQRIGYWSILLISIGFFLKIEIPTNHPRIEKIKTKHDQISLITHEGTITMIDHGAIGRHASVESYVEYTLLPTLTSLSGALHIDTLILLRPTKRLFNAITHLSSLIPIKTIYLVSWDDDIKDHSFWKIFWKFKNRIEQNTSNLKRIGPKDHTIPISKTSALHLTPTGTFVKYGAKIPYFTINLSTQHTVYPLE